MKIVLLVLAVMLFAIDMYQAVVITQQRDLIRDMIQNPTCVVNQ